MQILNHPSIFWLQTNTDICWFLLPFIFSLLRIEKVQNQSNLELEFFISLLDEISPIKKKVGLGVHRQGVYLKSHLLCFKLLLSYKQCNEKFQKWRYDDLCACFSYVWLC
jgi:hypothetical protein